MHYAVCLATCIIVIRAYIKNYVSNCSIFYFKFYLSSIRVEAKRKQMYVR